MNMGARGGSLLSAEIKIQKNRGAKIKGWPSVFLALYPPPLPQTHFPFRSTENLGHFLAMEDI